MKAIRLEQPWDIACVDTEMSVPTEGEALIKVKSVGICGSDINAFRGTNRLVAYPRIIGHEIAGEIISIPANNKEGLVSGDRVLINPYMYCGACYPCSIGRNNCCTDLEVVGNHVEGGMAEYFCHPADLLKKIPDEMSWKEAALVEAVSFALHSLHRGRLKKEEYCVIVGAGSRGLVASMAVLALGAYPIVIDYVPERLEFAKAVGVQYVINPDDEDDVAKVTELTGGMLAQMVLGCSDDEFLVRKALDYVSYAGRVVFAGWTDNKLSINSNIIAQKELDVLGAKTSVSEFDEAIDFICSKKVDVEKIITKTVSIEEAADVIIDMEQKPEAYMKVIIELE